MNKSLSQLTSSDAIIAAINEFDSIGREAFLSLYGYKPSRLYHIQYNGQLYDSKAIVGSAYGKQHGTPLKSSEFNGGKATVITCLRKLGFTAWKTENPAIKLVTGKTYFRKDLIRLYGGQLQAGIWTPSEFKVIFIFSGESGKAFGYKDGWKEDGIFRYTGEGQIGDMTFTGGNKAIRDHRENGKDILLFEDLGKGKGVRYTGMFECASWSYVDAMDKKKNIRKAIAFDLVPVSSSALTLEKNEAATQDTKSSSINELRIAAYEASYESKASSHTSDTKRSWYERSDKVKNYVLARASGFCEACAEPAPFSKKDGTPYLEPHHTKRLSDEGPDHPAWVGAICPNCHRRIHSGSDGEELNNKLQNYLKKLEEPYLK